MDMRTPAGRIVSENVPIMILHKFSDFLLTIFKNISSSYFHMIKKGIDITRRRQARGKNYKNKSL